MSIVKILRTVTPKTLPDYFKLRYIYSHKALFKILGICTTQSVNYSVIISLEGAPHGCKFTYINI